MDERVKAAVAKAGYKMAMTTEQGLSFWDDPLAIRRIGLSENDMLSDFILKVKIGRSYRQVALARLDMALRTGFNALRAPRMIKQTVHWLLRQR
jgi:hypothetical protein